MSDSSKPPWTTACQSSPSLTISGVCPSSCPLNQWCHPAISSFVTLFPFCLPSFSASGLFQWVNCLHQVAKVLELRCKQSYMITATVLNNKAPTGFPPPPLSHPLSPLHSGHVSLLFWTPQSLSSQAFAVDASSACKLLPLYLHLCPFLSSSRCFNVIFTERSFPHNSLPLLAGPMPAPIFLIKMISTWHMLELSKFSYSLFLWPKTWVSYLFYSWLYLSSGPGGEASYWA